MPPDIGTKPIFAKPVTMHIESKRNYESSSSDAQPPRLEKPVKITEQVWPEGTAPVVSIHCLTYNHEGFIRDAIEGFLMQETTFPVEILIHDDASTDNTANIIREYEAKYPQLIKPIYQTQNQWSQGNSPGMINLSRAFGEFIAFCEGDDYWSDPRKLHKQVLTLQSDEGIALAWCKLQLIDEAGNLLNRLPWNLEKDTLLTTDESVSVAMPGTQGVMLRRSRLDFNELKKFTGFPQGDYPMWLTSLRHDGLAYFSADCMAFYRRHAGGATASFGEPAKCRSIAEMWRAMAVSLDRLKHPAFRRQISTHYMWAARGFAEQAKLGDSLVDLRHAFAFSDQGIATTSYQFVKNSLRALLLWMRSFLRWHT